MELSSLKIKKFRIFSQKKVFLIFCEINFLALRIKHFLYFTTTASKFFLEKISNIFSRKKPALKKFLMFQEMELPSPKLKKL